MKRVLTLLLPLFFVGCGGMTFAPSSKNSLNVPLPSARPPRTERRNDSQTFDMLAWMTMDTSMRVHSHLAGSANPIYTTVENDKFFWTKTGKGYPWDVQLYDKHYIYLWVTELDWLNPDTSKIFESEKSGKFNMPLVPRFAEAGFPGSEIKVPKSESTYKIFTSCSQSETKDLGYVKNTLWGPYKESLGGDLPDDLETLVVSYQYVCDANYENCQDREQFHVAKPYGLVYWQHQKLQADGTYAKPDNSTVMNRVVGGQVKPFTTCFQ